MQILDGATEYSNQLGRFCSDIVPSSVTTMGNFMTVRFFTNVPDPKNGFSALVTTGGTRDFNIVHLHYVRLFIHIFFLDVCGGARTAPHGIITSPNYPAPYMKNETCAWVISAPTDHTIVLNFRDLHLPGLRSCRNNFVTIKEKYDENNDTREFKPQS